MRARSLSSVVVVAGLVLTLLGTPPVGSADPAQAASSATSLPEPDEVANVPSNPLPTLPDVPDGAEAIDRLPTEAPLPADTEVAVEPTDAWTRVADLPVKVSLPDDAVTEPAGEVEVSWETPEDAAQGAVVIGVDQVVEPVVTEETPAPTESPSASPSESPTGTPTSEPSPTPTETADPTEPPLDPIEPGAVAVEVPEVQLRLQYGGLDKAFGGGWADRMQIVAYPACYLDESAPAECLEGVPVEAERDAATKTLTWDTTDPALTDLAEVDAANTDTAPTAEPTTEPTTEPSTEPTTEPTTQPSGQATGESTVSPAMFVTNARATTVAAKAASTAPPAGSGGAVVFAVSGSSGSYAATPLPVSAGWQVGEASGEFTYSYPFAMPTALSGNTPELALTYSSGSVDGMNIAENGQASSAGIGWNLTTGYISRTYGACQDDNDTRFNGKGDLCWITSGGKPVEQLTLVLGGRSSRLIPILRNGGPSLAAEFRLEDDPGWKVERVTSANADNNDEAFKVTTPDGTQYWFGYGTSNGASTQSTWTVPVFSNDTGEPCYNATASLGWCSEAWQWNLDRVVDPFGNKIGYLYTPATNYYQRFATTRQIYDRAGILNKVEYGFGDGIAHQVVDITNTQRCVTKLTNPNGTCGDASDWPDTPRDLICTSSGNCSNVSPSFFSTLRYDTVTTKTYTGNTTTSTVRTVDTYQLTFTMPDPDGASGPDDPDLWLDRIQRTGSGGGSTPVTLPVVNFQGGPPCLPNSTTCVNDRGALRNRVVTPSGARAFTKFRIVGLRNEAGGRVDVVYGHAPGKGCDKQYLGLDTTTTSDDLKRYQSTKECFPQWYTPPGGTGGWEWFHRWVVLEVALGDDALGYRLGSTPATPSAYGSLRVFDYEYTGDPAWRYQPSPNVPDAKQTWNDWRGYGEVIVHTREVNNNAATANDRSRRRVVVYRGMDGSRINDNPAITQTVFVQTSDGAKLDGRWLQGRIADEREQLGGTTPLTYHAYSSVLTAAGGTFINARNVYESLTRRTDTFAGGVTKISEVTRTASQGGVVVTALDSDTNQNVDQYVGINAGTILTVEQKGWDGVKRCTTTDWIASSVPDTWILKPRVVTTYPGDCATPPTTTNPTAKVKYFYDNGDSGAAIVTGKLTTVSTFLSNSTSLDSQTEYDTKGRVVRQSDAYGNWTDTDYNPGGSDGDLVTGIKTTGPTGLAATTTLDARRGQPLTITDPTNAVTTLTYDGLGRLVTVRQPGNTGTIPSMEFVYVDNFDAPSRVVSKVLRSTDGTVDTTRDFYDGWGRHLETQVKPAHATSTTPRVFTGTGYDDMGLPYLQIPPSYSTSCCFASGLLVNPVLTDLDRYTITDHDGVGRTTKVTDKAKTGNSIIDFAASTYTLGQTTDGLTEKVSDLDGTNLTTIGTATTTTFDAWGRAVKVDQYDQAGTALAHTATYTYDSSDRLKKITAALPGTTTPGEWAYTYDWSGRRTQAVDPDTGTTNTSYDDNGSRDGTGVGNHSVTVTDATNNVVTTEWDALDRTTKRTGIQGGTATILGSWTYGLSTDPTANKRGRLLSASSDTPLGTFTRSVLAYDNRGNPTQTKWEYPSALTGEGGTTNTKTTSNITYNELGQVTSAFLPGVSVVGLPDLTVNTSYTDNGLFDKLDAGSTLTIGDAAYDNLNRVATLTSTGDNGTLTRTYNRYDETGWAKQISAWRGATSLLNLKYDTYDKRGNPTTITASGNPLETGTTPPDAKWCYTYDGLNRLTRATATTIATTDCNAAPITPVTSPLNGSTPYDINYTYAADRLIKTTTAGVAQAQDWTYQTGTHRTSSISTGSNTDTLAYDNAGRATSYARASDSTQYDYFYDPAGRVAAAVPAAGDETALPKIENGYDADGLRVATRSTIGTGSNQVVKTTVYLDNLEITKTTGGPTSGFSAVRRFSTDTGIPLGTQSKGPGTGNSGQLGWVWQLADAQGNLRYESAKSASTAGNYLVYKPYGGPVTPTLGAANRGYLNKQHDPDGSIALDHRYYRPDLNILTTPDPLLIPGDPQSLNPYAYSRNNPITLSDPTGLEPNTALAPGGGPLGFDRPPAPQKDPTDPTYDPETDPDRYYYNNPKNRSEGPETRQLLAGAAGFLAGTLAGGACSPAAATIILAGACFALASSVGTATTMALDGVDQSTGQWVGALGVSAGLGFVTSGLLKGASAGWRSAPASAAKTESGLVRRAGPGTPHIDDLGGLADRPGQIASRLGYSTRQVKDAIHLIKRDGLPRSGPLRNPDVTVDTASGDVYVKLPDGSLSDDPIGNIFEYLE